MNEVRENVEMEENNNDLTIAAKQKIIDEEHLRLLSIFHYILGAFILVYSLFVGVYLFFISFIMKGAFGNTDFNQITNTQVLSQIFGLIMTIMGIIFALTIIIGIAQILSGYFIKTTKLKWFSFIIAGINCLIFPFGTILGISTFMVLSRNSVNEIYMSEEVK